MQITNKQRMGGWLLGGGAGLILLLKIYLLFLPSQTNVAYRIISTVFGSWFAALMQLEIKKGYPMVLQPSQLFWLPSAAVVTIFLLWSARKVLQDRTNRLLVDSLFILGLWLLAGIIFGKFSYGFSYFQLGLKWALPIALGDLAAVAMIVGIGLVFLEYGKQSSGIHALDKAAETTKFKVIEQLGSVGLYLSMLYVGLAFFVIGVLIYSGAPQHTDQSFTQIFSLVMFCWSMGLMIFVFAQIYFYVLLYRIWRLTINESRANDLVPSIETPAKAVGLLFIPIYSFYWVFQAFGKLPKDLNALAKAQGSNKTIRKDLGTFLAVSLVLALIPIIGYFAAFVGFFILQPVFIKKSIETLAALNGQEDLPAK